MRGMRRTEEGSCEKGDRDMADNSLEKDKEGRRERNKQDNRGKKLKNEIEE